jgi:hypothetical protein
LDEGGIEMKWLIGVGLVLLMMGTVVAGVPVGNGIKDYSFKYKGGKVMAEGNYFNNNNPGVDANIKAFCLHDDKTYLVGSSIVKYSNSVLGKQAYFYITSYDTPCVKGDLGWVSVNGVDFEKRDIIKKSSKKVVVVVEELPEDDEDTGDDGDNGTGDDEDEGNDDDNGTDTKLEKCIEKAYDLFNKRWKNPLRNWLLEKDLEKCEEKFGG